MLRTFEEVESRQLRVLESGIAQKRNEKVQASRETMEREVQAIRTRIRTLAVLLPPVPVLLVVALFLVRARHERRTARPRAECGS